MGIDFQRKVDRMAGKFICWMLSLVSRRQKKIPLESDIQKILVILLSEMGSPILAQPMFAHIRAKHPGATVYVLLFNQNKEVLELVDVVPSENIITVRNTSLTRFLSDSFSSIIKMHKIKIDTVIDCELFSRVSAIYSFLSGAKIRAGFHPHTQEGLFRGDFINQPVLYNPYHHISQQFITLAEAIGSETIPKAKRLPAPDKLVTFKSVYL